VPFLHKAIVAIYSHVAHQPSGTRRFWFGVRTQCRNAVPNCGRHRLPTNEHHARRASWMRTDRATSSIKGTSESFKRIITLHTRVLPERALIYTQQSVFTQKTKHQSTQPAGCHKNGLKSHQTGRQDPHCIAKLSTNPPSQVYLPTGYGNSAIRHQEVLVWSTYSAQVVRNCTAAQPALRAR